jgi:sigma-E factor negative regulatory protein RseB
MMRFHFSANIQSLKQATIVGLLLSFSQSVFADHISDLMNNMSQAEKNLNYEGVFVLRKADKIMSMRVSHAADENGVRESLETLNGEARRVISNNNDVLSIYPSRKLLIISKDNLKSRLHPTLPENLEKLQQHYDIERQADDRIANHATTVLKLTPKDDSRYGYRYWVDADTGVLLRCDLTDTDDTVIEQMMFTQFEYKDELPASAFSYSGLEDYTRKNLNKDRVQIDDLSWRVNDLPAGFMLTQSSKRKDDDFSALHLVYSDGLASVSVFVEQGRRGNHYLEGASSMGALNAYGTRQGEYYITVMGEAPANTVRQIATSTERVELDDTASLAND